MLLDRAFRLSTYLTLGLASLALGLAEWTYLPEMPVFVVPTLIILVVAYRTEGRWVLSATAANGVAFVIVLTTGVWVGHRFSTFVDLVLEDAPGAAAMLPFLGPVLMLLMLAKLFRPKRPNDFWLLHTIGLMMIVLGSVLASDLIFGVLMYAYLISALWSMTLFYIYREHVLGIDRAREVEKQRAQDRRRRRSKPKTPQGVVTDMTAEVGQQMGLVMDMTVAVGQPLTPWRLLGLWQASGLSLLVLAAGMALFLVTPHFGQRWAPFPGSRDHKQSTTGYSDGAIDLTRVGEIKPDNRVAFEIRAFDADGTSPKRNLSLETRFRGATMRSYDRGRWMPYAMSSALHGSPAASKRRTLPDELPDLGPNQYFIDFDIDTGVTNGLFLAEPVVSPPAQEPLPVINLGRLRPSFHDRDGTLMATLALRQGDYRYRQVLVPSAERDLSPPLEEDFVCDDIAHQHIESINNWTRALVETLVRQGKLDRTDVLLGTSMATPRENWEKVARVFCDHLAHSREFTYTLVLQRVDRKVDPTFDFLNNVKKGHCERYATALALMLRSVGIPARVIKGFRGCEQRPDDRGAYFVRQSNAHSWVEAIVQRTSADGDKRLHWLMLEPTPNTSADEMQGASAFLFFQRIQLLIETAWRNYVVDYNSDQRKEAFSYFKAGINAVKSWFTTAGHLASGPLSWDFWTDPRPWLILGAGAGVFVAWRRKKARTRKERENPHSIEFYAEFLRVLERRCRVQPNAAQTPGEFARTAREALRLRHVAEDILDFPKAITAFYYRVRFGGEPLSADESADVRTLIGRLERALLSARPA